MASGYAVKQAADLMDAAFLARWTDREAIGPLARRALGVIIRRLAAGEGALPVTGLFPDLAPGEVADAIAELDHHDRKSTRLNSSHSQISYAVFCLKKKT